MEQHKAWQGDVARKERISGLAGTTRLGGSHDSIISYAAHSVNSTGNSLNLPARHERMVRTRAEKRRMSRRTARQVPPEIERDWSSAFAQAYGRGQKSRKNPASYVSCKRPGKVGKAVVFTARIDYRVAPNVGCVVRSNDCPLRPRSGRDRFPRLVAAGTGGWPRVAGVRTGRIARTPRHGHHGATVAVARCRSNR